MPKSYWFYYVAQSAYRSLILFNESEVKLTHQHHVIISVHVRVVSGSPYCLRPLLSADR